MLWKQNLRQLGHSVSAYLTAGTNAAPYRTARVLDAANTFPRMGSVLVCNLLWGAHADVKDGT